MQTQRDHVHAYQFMMGRISSALVEGDPTGAEIPGRRAQTGLVIGVLLMVLVVAGFAVYGWIVPGGSTAYTKAGVIIVEKETGDRYVYLEGALHPVPDLTSAMLIQGASSTVKLISQNSLKDVPRSVPLGVQGAPSRLPSAGDLVQGPWMTCLPSSVVASSKSDGLGVVLNPDAPAVALPQDSFSVVQAEDGTPYLLANHLKYKITNEAVLVALGAGATQPARAPQMWLDWLADGTDLGPADIPGAGDQGPRVGDKKYDVGTLFRVSATGTAGDQLFVLRRDGLAPVSRTEFAIADAADPGAPVDLDPSAVVDARRSSDSSLLTRLPDLAALKLYDLANQALCIQQGPADAERFTSSVVTVAKDWSGVDDQGEPYVLMRRGTGMVAMPAPRASRTGSKNLSFISDEGKAYRLADDTTVASLKLSGTTPVPFPKTLLAALPQGPVLSREAVTVLTGS